MNTKDDGGSEFRCSRCGIVAAQKQGHQWLCARHYRIGQMRSTARRDGKVIPTHEQLEAMLRDTCADCGVVMNMLSRDGERARTASLQHYRDGSLAVVCVSCNTRHAAMPGDTFRDMQNDSKRCPRCETVKPLSNFGADLGRSGPMKFKSWCKPCASASHTEWQRNNREHYNAKQREARAARRAAG